MLKIILFLTCLAPLAFSRPQIDQAERQCTELFDLGFKYVIFTGSAVIFTCGAAPFKVHISVVIPLLCRMHLT